MGWCLDQLTLAQLDFLPVPEAGDPSTPTMELDTLPLECPGLVGDDFETEHYSGDGKGLGFGSN